MEKERKKGLIEPCVGGVYTFQLKRNIDNKIKAGERLAIVIQVEKYDVVAVTLTVNVGDYFDDRRVYSRLKVHGVTKEVCILTDLPLILPIGEFGKKVATIPDKLVLDITEKTNEHTPIRITDDHITIDDSGIEVIDEETINLVLAENEFLDNHWMHLQTEKYYILDSRSVMLDEPTSLLYIPLFLHGHVNGVFCVFFVEDGNKKPQFEKKIEDGVLKIRCVNFSEELGRFSITPIQVATLEGKKVCMQIKSSLSGTGDQKVRIVEYTVFLEK